MLMSEFKAMNLSRFEMSSDKEEDTVEVQDMEDEDEDISIIVNEENYEEGEQTSPKHRK